MDAYFEDLGARYYRYLKFGERTVTAKERNWLDKISISAQDEEFSSVGVRRRHCVGQVSRVEGADQIEMLHELRQRLNDNGESTIVLRVFVFLAIAEVAGAILFPILARKAGNRSVMVVILMALAGLVLGSLIVIGIALPILRLYDYHQRRKIAWLIARILVIEWLYDISILDAETFFDIDVATSVNG